MDFKNGVINIQAAGYNVGCTLYAFIQVDYFLADMDSLAEMTLKWQVV